MKSTAIGTGAESPIAVLMSGGLDSTIVLGLLARQRGKATCRGAIQPIYVRCGLNWEAEELSAVREVSGTFGPIVAPVVVLEMQIRDLCPDHWSVTGRGVPSFSSPDEAVYLPGRNFLLLAKAGVWCQLHGVSEMAIGVLDTNPFGDASDEFFEHVEGCLLAYGPEPVRILRPLSGRTKREWMLAAGDIPLAKTFSCIAPRKGLHCGACNKCAERRRAFREAGLPDETVYYSASDPVTKPRS